MAQKGGLLDVPREMKTSNHKSFQPWEIEMKVIYQNTRLMKCWFTNVRGEIKGPPGSIFIISNQPTSMFKITPKVAFKVASEASYVYILSGQKLIKKPKIVNFDEFLKSSSLRPNSVTRQGNFDRTKICGKCQN